jgi:hypothetical protein
MQEASREEAIGPNVFKTNNLCMNAGAEEEGHPTNTIKGKEKEQTLKSFEDKKEEEEGDTSSKGLKGRKDHDHVLMVGKIRVSLRKGLG